MSILIASCVEANSDFIHLMIVEAGHLPEVACTPSPEHARDVHDKRKDVVVVKIARAAAGV
jgi:hypothetical protein